MTQIKMERLGPRAGEIDWIGSHRAESNNENPKLQ
jgi:hypothetical protein